MPNIISKARLGKLLLLVAGFFIISGFGNSYRNTDYINEMPSVEKVRAAFKGSDEIDTKAKTCAAFWQLQHIIISRTRGSQDHSAGEQKWIDIYGYQGNSYLHVYNGGWPPEYKLFIEKMNPLRESKAFQNQILYAFFSVKWIEGYRKDVAQRQAEEMELIQSQANNQTSSSYNHGIPILSELTANAGTYAKWGFVILLIFFGFISAVSAKKGEKKKALFEFWIWSFVIGALALISGWLVLVFIIGYSFYKKRKKKVDDKFDIEAYNKVIYSEFEALGSTKEERGKTIKKMFENKEGTVHFQWYLEHSEQYKNSQGGWVKQEGCFKKISIQRNIASIENKEREMLRNVFLLFNEDKLAKDDYRYFLFAFVNGNGKANILDWNYWTHPDHSGVKDAPTTVKYLQDKWDASVDSAVNKLLHKVDTLGVQEEGGKALKEMKNRIRGGGAWLSDDEVDGTIFNGHGKYKLSLGTLDDSNTPLSYDGEGSLITIAPPGSGKTQCFVIPNMLSWQGAAVVLDIKGEIYAATSKWREKNIGKIFKFSPLDPANSNSYNPLTYIRQDPDYVWEDSRFLADMMIVPSGAQDQFWESKARDVLTAAIAYISFSNEPYERPMSKVLDLVYGIGWDEMILSLKTNVFVNAMKQTGHSLSNMDAKQRESVLQTAQNSLSAWQGERIAKVTQKSDWSPLDLRDGSPTIYICINPNEIDSYLSVLRVFIAQHIRMLTNELPKRGASPVLFMLDELPRLKKMPPVDEALNVGRQYGIKLWMFTQSYGQLKEAYPNPEGLLGSCVVRTFMNLPLNDEITTKISDQLGYRDGPLDASKQKLVEPLELAGPNYRDTILVLATNTKPAKVRKKFAYEDEEVKAKINELTQI